MKEVFADTAYWVALTDRLDNLYHAAVQACQGMRDAKIVTSDAVLIEFLNAFSGSGAHLRNVAAQTVDEHDASTGHYRGSHERSSLRAGRLHDPLEAPDD